jgi:hypothetical protein
MERETQGQQQDKGCPDKIGIQESAHCLEDHSTEQRARHAGAQQAQEIVVCFEQANQQRQAKPLSDSFSSLAASLCHPVFRTYMSGATASPVETRRWMHSSGG